MTVLTLTPEARAFAVALVALASTSAATLASMVHAWRRAPAADFLPTYACVMALVAGLAVVLLGVPHVHIPTWRELGWALLVGAAACIVALRGEAAIRRRLRR
nr:hypothetical protein [Caulobacteraceae bacterium]